MAGYGSSPWTSMRLPLLNGGPPSLPSNRLLVDASSDGVVSGGSNKKKRGRPLGSKNRPKTPIMIRSELEATMKMRVLEINTGFDIIEALRRYAHMAKTNIKVLSGVGMISDVGICQHSSQSKSLVLEGHYSILSLNGKITIDLAMRPSSIANAQALSPSRVSFSVSVVGSYGQVYGGVVTGNLIAATTVTVVVLPLVKPYIYKLPSTGTSTDGNNIRLGSNENNGAQYCIPSSSAFEAFSTFNIHAPGPTPFDG